jgi:hypothetical protein
MAIGVFGLQVAYKLKRLEVMSTDDTHGWFGGGGNPVVATVDRIDFSNDTGTANIRGPLSVAKRDSAATGNSNYGWFGGGYIPTPAVVSTVDRIDFANDSVAVSVRGPLSIERGFLAATGNSNYGWFGGGINPSVTPNIFHSRVDRIDFSNDSSTTSPRGPLSIRKGLFTATGNSNYGWFGGGYTGPGVPGFLTTVDRIDFSNDSPSTTTRGPLNSSPTYGQGKQGLAATGNFNYGWFAGGGDAATPILNVVDRIDFSNDTTTASSRGLLLVAKNRMGAAGNSNYGWFGGGNPGPLASVDRIDFSNDSATASIRGPLSSARLGPAATSGQAKGPAIKLQKAGNYGWFGGGRTPATTATVDRIDFSNDTITGPSLVRGSLSLARFDLAATGNSNYGWFGGGGPSGSSVETIDRIDFSNDNATASVRGPLSSARYNLAATGNSNYGWFGGGFPGPVATVDRIDFSNDSVRASPRGPLFTARYSMGATGNSNYGWFGGGIPGPVATVNRIDFSNDSSTASVRGSLSLARSSLSATGNSNYGWFGGGGFPPTATVDRIDFSNDSSTAVARGPLSSARYGIEATGNSNYGWFGGGRGGSPLATVATVDRIDFSNDSVSVSLRGLLSATRYRHAATSNTHIG